MKQFLISGMLTIVTAALAPAQFNNNMVTITPRITGGDSVNGKCIVRIMVDNTVNVRIGNGQIRVETLAGAPSRDDGSECTSMLRNGRNLTDFRFKGIDGRGEVRLQSDPRQDSRGEAVVYIRDSKGGDEGYTFEVSWSGDNGQGFNQGGGGFFGGGGRNNNNRNNNNNSIGYDQALNSCMDQVRGKVSRDYNVSNLNFDQVNANNNQGRRDRIAGTARSGNGRRNTFRYECEVNMNNGNVRNVNVWRN
jgi:hypothetical protein